MRNLLQYLFTPSYAATINDLFNEGVATNSGVMEIVGGIIGISSAVAIVSLSICAIKYMAAEDSRRAAEAKDNAKTVIFAWILLGLFIAIASAIVSAIGDFTL